MRILYWILGVAASAAAAAYVAKHRGKKSVIDQFIAALETKNVTVFSECDGIPMRNVREQWFAGVADGVPFHFNARTDRHSTRWVFVLTWKGEPYVERWNVLKRGRARTLAAVHLALKRLPVRREGND
ncbi:MAG: hypothetical protein QY323_05330 [Patescibacteria group bacterium]|nr:MAG: hypothetical protein QY323_05330 [Patescibacteria group bacterium]